MLTEKIGDPKLQENLDSEIAIMRDYQHPNIGSFCYWMHPCRSTF
jgi:hypothetical protein